eukprot:12416546-Karenia_brevis.AAC.1
MIVKTQNLALARRVNYKPECCYHWGLQPTANTTPTIEPQWWAFCIGQGDQVQNWECPIKMFTDGVGGDY